MSSDLHVWSQAGTSCDAYCSLLQVPIVTAEAQAALAAGQAVVIGLQSTGEAAADAMQLEPGQTCGFVSTTRELLTRFVAQHFPVRYEPGPNEPAGIAEPVSGHCYNLHMPAQAWMSVARLLSLQGYCHCKATANFKAPVDTMLLIVAGDTNHLAVCVHCTDQGLMLCESLLLHSIWTGKQCSNECSWLMFFDVPCRCR